ncbi:MAG: hypothetical protein WAW69_06185 [Polaromonas sp.]
MNKLDGRIKALEARRAEQCKGLAGSDAELAALLGDGFGLSLVPGDTRDEKLRAIDRAYWGELQLPPEARHAARGWFDMLAAV